jgi:hypothetical protein
MYEKKGLLFPCFSLASFFSKFRFAFHILLAASLSASLYLAVSSGQQRAFFLGLLFLRTALNTSRFIHTGLLGVLLGLVVGFSFLS